MGKMKQCKTCSKEIAVNAKSCPECGAKNKKPVYKKPWFIVVAFFLIIGALGGSGSDESTTTSDIASSKQEIIQSEEKEQEVVAVDEIEDNVPTEYKSALKKAKIYSDTMSMSKAGLYDQLTSEYGEKFTAEEAQYAIDNLEANWKENALKKAKTYQDSMAMSPSAIYDQLISDYGEKFTAEEAQYAVDNL